MGMWMDGGRLVAISGWSYTPYSVGGRSVLRTSVVDLSNLELPAIDHRCLAGLDWVWVVTRWG